MEKSSKLNNAINLYMEGIRDGKVNDAIEKYTGDQYKQHSTVVKDGAAGFIEFFKDFVTRYPRRDIKILRSLEEGPYVFLHALQNLNDGEALWVTMDLFDTDSNEKIVEHWDVIAPYDGESQVDGATEIDDLDKTEENKKLVKSLIEDVLMIGKKELLPKYISGENYINHSSIKEDDIHKYRYNNIFKIIGQGNFVVSYSKVICGEAELAVFDIFRLHKGVIVEHWDTSEEILPRDQWVNSGKF